MKKAAIKATHPSVKCVDAVVFKRVVQALDTVPVLHKFVEQHLYAIPPHTFDAHRYVFDGHELADGKHEYCVLVIDPATYVEAVYEYKINIFNINFKEINKTKLIEINQYNALARARCCY